MALAQNAAARGAARVAKAAVPAVPTTRATPMAPVVNLSTRTYSGPAPAGAASSATKASGVDLANRFSVQPGAAQSAARAGIATEQARRTGNAQLERDRDARVKELNDMATKAGIEENYTVVGDAKGGTQIVKQTGYDPSTGKYAKSEVVSDANFKPQKSTGTTYGVSSGTKADISGADAELARLKEAVAGGKQPGEDDYTYQMRIQNLNSEIANKQNERQSAIDAESGQRATESSLEPDLLAAVGDAHKLATGRIQAETGSSAVSAAPPEIQDIFQEHPEMAKVYEPLVEALARDDKQQAQALFATLTRLDKQGERSAKVAQDAIAAAKEYHVKLADQTKEAYGIQMDIAAENKAQGEFDKAQFEHKQAFLISQKVDEAADNELINRRAAAAMGFSSDTNGLTSMQKEARRAQEAISFLQTETNMVTAEMGRRITSEYSLATRDLAQKNDAVLLQLDHSLSSSLSEIQSTLNMGDEKRAEAYESAYQGYLNKVSANDIKTAEIYGNIVGKLNDQAFELKKIKMQEDRTDKRMAWQEDMADKRMRFQEAQQDKRLSFQESNANRRFELELGKTERAATRQQMLDEKKETEGIRTDFRTDNSSATVKSYKEIRNANAQAIEALNSALASGDPIELGAAKEAIGVFRAKSLDPTSVVRESEYARIGMAQSWIDKVKNVGRAIEGGDMSGLSTESIKVFAEALQMSTDVMKGQALAEYTPSINRLIEFNNSSEHLKMDPRTVLEPEFIEDTLLKSFYQSTDSGGYNYDYGKYSGSPGADEPMDTHVTDPLAGSLSATGMTMDEIYGDFEGMEILSTPQSRRVIEAGDTESVGEVLSSMAPVTQGFDTPISSTNYSKSTVKAWGGTHQGIDVAMPWGSFVPSVSAGTLMSVEYNKGGWGLTAVIKAPDGAEIRYSHLMSVDPRLKIGQAIEKGREIAQVGNTGNVFSTSGGDGTHLDLRIRKGGKYIDPYSYYS